MSKKNEMLRLTADGEKISVILSGATARITGIVIGETETTITVLQDNGEIYDILGGHIAVIQRYKQQGGDN